MSSTPIPINKNGSNLPTGLSSPPSANAIPNPEKKDRPMQISPVIVGEALQWIGLQAPKNRSVYPPTNKMAA